VRLVRRSVGAVLVAGLLATTTAHAEVPLVWHVETMDGDDVTSARADEPVNPASVVKLATTLVALEQLGSRHRFETVFGAGGTFDSDSGVLDGDLIVVGGGDPDFHVENGMLVAQALRDAGLRTVTGALVVDDRFWIGWEGGSERRQRDPVKRAQSMAVGLRAALDPKRWNDGMRKTWQRSAARARGGATPARIAVRGGVQYATGRTPDRMLATHRSNPLVRTFKRLNVHSNNDIERFEASIGSAATVGAGLGARWDFPPSSLRLATLSGLGSNRIPARAIVRLLVDLAAVCEREGIDVAELLAVSGCNSGTLRWLPGLSRQPAGALVAKTGTLVVTDGGVVALAGYAYVADTTLRFAVAAPRAGKGVPEARQAIATWVKDLAGQHGGFPKRSCTPRSGYSDDAASAVAIK